MKSSSGTARAVSRCADDLPARLPRRHQREQQRADDQRQPAAVRDLQGVRAEEREIDRQEHAGHRERDARPASASARSPRRAGAPP